MTITIKKGESKQSIDRKIRKLSSNKNGFPAHLFTGKVKVSGDPLTMQRQLREEWQ